MSRPLMRGLRLVMGACLVLVATMWGSIAANAVAPSDGSDGMVWLDVSKDPTVFTDSHIVRNVGIKVDGGCRWTFNQVRQRGEAMVGAQEVARNMTTCVELVRAGHVKPLPAQTGGTSASSSAPLIPAAKHRAVDPCDTEDFKWWDPIGILVTEVQTSDCWGYDYYQHLVWGCESPSDYRYWYTTSGWYESYHNGPWYYYNGDSSACTAYTSDQFNNDVFCPTGSTYTNYYDNQLIMWWNGSVSNGTTSWVSGQCTNLLHWTSNH
jgi:hypothetical protein